MNAGERRERAGADSICAMRSASRSFAICSSVLFAALRSSLDFFHAQLRSLFFCHLSKNGYSRVVTDESQSAMCVPV
jgi:hypothetical protein